MADHKLAHLIPLPLLRMLVAKSGREKALSLLLVDQTLC
jgi:hypothetical protein